MILTIYGIWYVITRTAGWLYMRQIEDHAPDLTQQPRRTRCLGNGA